jgi:hypothetical protein
VLPPSGEKLLTLSLFARGGLALESESSTAGKGLHPALMLGNDVVKIPRT